MGNLRAIRGGQPDRLRTLELEVVELRTALLYANRPILCRMGIHRSRMQQCSTHECRTTCLLCGVKWVERVDWFDP
jgi:hypothetical protein